MSVFDIFKHSDFYTLKLPFVVALKLFYLINFELISLFILFIKKFFICYFGWSKFSEMIFILGFVLEFDEWCETDDSELDEIDTFFYIL